MDWLQDKKNLPIVAGVTGLVIALAVVFLIMQFRKSSGTGPVATGTEEQLQMPSMTLPDEQRPVQTPAPVVAGAAGAPTFPAQEAREDPFRPFQQPGQKAPPPPPLYVPSPGRLFPPKAERDIVQDLRKQAALMAPQPRRRMAGLLYNQRLYAILETEGESQVVKPGDLTADGKARVEIIEPTRIILKTTDAEYPQTIEVKMAGADSPAEGAIPTPSEMTAPTPTGPYGPYPSMTLPS